MSSIFGFYETSEIIIMGDSLREFF